MIHYYVKIYTKAKPKKYFSKSSSLFRFSSYKEIKTYKGAIFMKKIASLVLTVALLATMLSVFAVPASAETGTIDGTDITWELSEDCKTLTFTGKGAMPDYDTKTYRDRPWANAAKTVTTVQINPGITTLGNFAFFLFKKMTSVTIPYGIKSIGNNAFQDCTNLESVSFPSSITSIGANVFDRCSNLTSVTVKAKTPPDWTNLMNLFNQNAKLKLYIPDGKSEDYKVGTWYSAVSQKIAKEAYVVDDQPGKNGTIMLDKDCFPKKTYTAANQTVTVTVMPAEGYQLKADSLTASYKDENGAEKTADLTQDETDPMKYTFTMPCSNVTVKAEFEEKTDESEPTLTATVFSEGNIWIIIAVAVVVLGGIVALVIVKKKKKPELADE